MKLAKIITFFTDFWNTGRQAYKYSIFVCYENFLFYFSKIKDNYNFFGKKEYYTQDVEHK